MDGDDYESLPAASTMGTHMVAGAAAGVMEHTLMYPVDCVKVCTKQAGDDSGFFRNSGFLKLLYCIKNV